MDHPLNHWLPRIIFKYRYIDFLLTKIFEFHNFWLLSICMCMILDEMDTWNLYTNLLQHGRIYNACLENLKQSKSYSHLSCQFAHNFFFVWGNSLCSGPVFFPRNRVMWQGEIMTCSMLEAVCSRGESACPDPPIRGYGYSQSRRNLEESVPALSPTTPATYNSTVKPNFDDLVLSCCFDVTWIHWRSDVIQESACSPFENIDEWI